MDSSVHIDNKKKDILILGKGPTQALDGTTLAAQKMCLINFTEHNKKFCLSLHYNGENSYLFVNRTEIIKFKAKDSETVAAPLYLGNISKDFSEDNMKKTRFYGHFQDFNIDYDAIAFNDILDIHKYLIKNHDIKCLGLLKSVYCGNWIYQIKHSKSIEMCFNEFKVRPVLMNINSDEPSFYPYSILVNKCSRICNNINDLYMLNYVS